METFSFSALGTEWTILVDESLFPESHRKAILEAVAVFENRFSRFLSKSEVNQFRDASAGTYQISREFALLLTRADRLRTLTGGIYNPAVGGLLEHTGYDQHYRLQADDQAISEYQLPVWSLAGDQLTLSGGAVFDFGGIGKGYCIDMVATLLGRQGYEYFIVEGGGDMYGTKKRDGSAYRVALEWPGRPDTAFGVVELQYQGIAVSDTTKRRWGQGKGAWHHIIDPEKKQPIESVVGATAVAPTAFAADCMTSGLFLSDPGRYGALAEDLGAQFVVFRNDGTVQKSPDWQGELF
ncbi:MAG: FAD:protein FMN transferase [Candidatus Moranbacteria bacterium]|nr:FAD:protein FMN transferase [Candidatus Moranbacteria bacterium]